MIPNIFDADQPATTTPAPAQAPQPGLSLPDSVASAPLDLDGNPIMPPWSANDETIRRYNLQTTAWRTRRSHEWVEAEIAKANKPERTSGGGGKKFSTQYSVDWAKTQKRPSGLAWRIVDRENWAPSHHKDKPVRSYDLMLGMDVLCDDGRPGLVGLQAGTPGQEKDHARTFLMRGGFAKAAQYSVRPYWIAFERGNRVPVEGPVLWSEDYLKGRFPDLFAPAKALEL